MKKQIVVVIIVGVVLSVWFIRSILMPALTPDQIYIQPSLTPTINYYMEDLYAQCRGLEYFKVIKDDNDRSLELNRNFNKEYQKTLAFIERDKKMLGIKLFKCP
jgi:hypothetical protein